MIVLSDFSYTFTPEQQVAIDWFCKTYIKKMADSHFKEVMQSFHDDFKEKLLLAKNNLDEIKVF